jgi:hypothetical protein
MAMRHVRPRFSAALALLLLALLLLSSSIAASAGQAPQNQENRRRANARKLLRIADGASRQLIQAGQGRLDREARSRAFWEALLHMDAQIDRVGAGLRTRDLSFFQALRTGTASLAELQVAWALAGIKDPAVEQNLRMLSAAYGRLRHRYGPEWVRFQAGRPLSEDERLRFARMRAEQGLLAGRIEPLRDRAARAGDDATVDELTLLLAQIHAVATASPTLGDYLDASVATDSIRGAWHGARAAHAADEEGWAEADQVVSDITTDESVGFVFTTDLSSVKDWSFVEEETEIPAEIAQADAGGGEQLSPGQIVDLGAIEESDLTDRTDPTAPTDSEMSLEEPEVLILDEAPAEEDLSTEAVPGDEAIEEEELDVETPAGDSALEPCPAGSPECGDGTHLEENLEESPPPPAASPAPPPPTAPDSLPIG